MDNNSDLRDIFRRAADIASAVPESMQEAAFHRALDALQADSEVPESSRPEQQPKRPRDPDQTHRSAATTNDRIDVDVVQSFNELARDRAQSVDAEEAGRGKAMALLRVAQVEFDVDGMTASEISTVLTEKFRWRVTRQAIGQALDGAGRMVDRVKAGRATKFRLMAEGEKCLDSSPGDRPRASSAATGRNPSPKAVRNATSPKKTTSPTEATKSKPKPAQASNSSKSSSGKARRSGPKAAVEALIGSGYFATAHTISEIREMLEEQTARKFKQGDLSPTMVRLLRENALSRSKNSDGQYEYVVSST